MEEYVILEIGAPQTHELKRLRFPKSMKVGEAAREAANAFGLKGTAYTLREGDMAWEKESPYQRSQALGQCYVYDGKLMTLAQVE